MRAKAVRTAAIALAIAHALSGRTDEAAPLAREASSGAPPEALAELNADRAAADAAHAEEVRKTVEKLTEEVRKRDAVVDAKQAEIDRRGGLRWWLRLPLYRFGLLKSRD